MPLAVPSLDLKGIIGIQRDHDLITYILRREDEASQSFICLRTVIRATKESLSAPTPDGFSHKLYKRYSPPRWTPTSAPIAADSPHPMPNRKTLLLLDKTGSYHCQDTNFQPERDLALTGVGSHWSMPLREFKLCHVQDAECDDSSSPIDLAPDLSELAASGVTDDLFGIHTSEDDESEFDSLDEDEFETSSESLNWLDHTSDSEPDSYLDRTLLDRLKQIYLKQLIAGYKSHPIESLDDPEAVDAPGEQSAQQRVNQRERRKQSSSRRGAGIRKRPLSEDSNGDNGEEGEDNDPELRKDPLIKDDVNKNSNFACPFAKRDPQQYAQCFGHNLRDVSRVKQHLRVCKLHIIPIYCINCSEVFPDEQAKYNHIFNHECRRQLKIKWEGITEDQRRQLNKRPHPNSTPVQRWNAIYQILFPDEPVPSSPYVELSLAKELCAFRHFEMSQAPAIWNKILHDQLPEHLRPHQADLQDLCKKWLQEALETVYQVWSSRELVSSPSQSSSSKRRRTDQEQVETPDTALSIDSSPSCPVERSGQVDTLTLNQLGGPNHAKSDEQAMGSTELPCRSEDLEQQYTTGDREFEDLPPFPLPGSLDFDISFLDTEDLYYDPPQTYPQTFT